MAIDCRADAGATEVAACEFLRWRSAVDREGCAADCVSGLLHRVGWHRVWVCVGSEGVAIPQLVQRLREMRVSGRPRWHRPNGWD